MSRVSRNVALVAHAPRLRSIPRVEQRSWTADELRIFLQAAPRAPALRGPVDRGFTGMRRNELLGPRWGDFDEKAATVSINRGLVAIDYEVHETRGKTPRSRRRIDLDPTTVGVLTAWREWQRAEQRAAGIEGAAGCSPTAGASRSIPRHLPGLRAHRRRAGVPVIRLHELRHTHGTLLIAAGLPVKVVSERLGHAVPAFTIERYQHMLPGMQADAARVFEQFVASSSLPVDQVPEKSVATREKGRKKTV